MNFGEKLHQLRTDNHLTQQDVAIRLGMTKSNISYYETGIKTPPADILIKLAKIFHVSTDYLLDISATETVSLDNYENGEQEIVFRLLQYFDGAASAVHEEYE